MTPNCHSWTALLLGAVVGCAADKTPAEPCPEGSHREADGLCHLDDTAAPAGAGADSGAGLPTDDPCGDLPGGLSAGDPVASGAPVRSEEFLEHLDAALLGDGRALLGANNGWAVLDLAAGRFTHVEFATARSVYRLAADPEAGLAWGGTQSRGLMRWDLSTDPPTMLGEVRAWSGWHGDVAADGGRALLALGADGAVLLGADGEVLGRIEGPALAVALEGDRALVSDGSTLQSWSLVDPENAELDGVVELSGHAADLALQGQRAAVAAGSAGVHLVELDDAGAPVWRESWSTPAAAYGVAIDGDAVWGAAWDGVVFGRWDADGPLRLGEERTPGLALGVDARGGEVVVADWTAALPLTGATDRSGPALRAPTRLDLVPDLSGSMVVENAGQGGLQVAFAPESGLTAAPEQLVLCAGEQAVVTVEADTSGRIGVETNAVDALEDGIQVERGAGGLGAAHPPVELALWDPVAGSSAPWSLADHAGELVYIGWFAPS